MQKDEENEQRQRRAENQRVPQPLERRLHVLGVTIDVVVVEVAVVAAHDNERLLGFLRDMDRVGLGLLVQENRNDGFAAQKRGALGFLHRVEHHGHIFDAHGRAPGTHDVRRRDFIEGFVLAGDAQAQVQRTLANLAAREGDVAACQRGANVRHRDAVDRQLPGIRLYDDFAIGSAHDLGLTDAVDLLERRLEHLACKLRQ